MIIQMREIRNRGIVIDQTYDENKCTQIWKKIVIISNDWNRNTVVL